MHWGEVGWKMEVSAREGYPSGCFSWKTSWLLPFAWQYSQAISVRQTVTATSLLCPTPSASFHYQILPNNLPSFCLVEKWLLLQRLS
jgi:hypothetical protein